MASKKTNPNTSESVIEIKQPLVLEEYYCLKEMQPRPVTMLYLETLAERLVEFADRENTIGFNKFYREYKVNKTCIWRWKKICNRLELAYEYARAAFGEKREEGSITKKFDTSGVWKRQYQFGDEYREAMEFAAKLAKREEVEDGGGIKFIVMGDMKSDPSMEKHFKTDKKDE